MHLLIFLSQIRLNKLYFSQLHFGCLFIYLLQNSIEIRSNLKIGKLYYSNRVYEKFE